MDVQLLKVTEAAKVCGLGRSKMYELVSGPSPEVRTVKIGRSRRIPVAELQAFIARLQAEQAPSR